MTKFTNAGNTALIMHPRNAKWFLIMMVIWIVLGGVGLSLEIDRSIFKWINTRHSEWGDTLFPYLTHLGTATFMLLAFTILWVLFPKVRRKEIFITAILANFIPFLLVQGLKHLFAAPRPMNYYQNADWLHTIASQPMNMHNSFPSGHTAGAFSFIAFVACLLPKQHTWLGVVLFIIASIVAYSRMYLAQHFYVDVYVGAIFGTLASLFIVAIMNKYYVNSTNKRRLQNE